VIVFATEGGRAILVELSIMEQRYHAVMEVISGAPVTEVAGRYGVTHQAVHNWLAKYRTEAMISSRPLPVAVAGVHGEGRQRLRVSAG
jgi:transposase-like protein